MRRSSQVVAPLLASAAVALLAGCHHQDMQRCVDEQNRVVDAKFCQNLPQGQNGQGIQGQGGAGTNGGYYGGYHPMYRYYYGGGGGYGLGSTVTGGSYAPLAGHSYSSGTSRGGFGSSFSSHGGGEGGGGE